MIDFIVNLKQFVQSSPGDIRPLVYAVPASICLIFTTMFLPGLMKLKVCLQGGHRVANAGVDMAISFILLFWVACMMWASIWI